MPRQRAKMDRDHRQVQNLRGMVDMVWRVACKEFCEPRFHDQPYSRWEQIRIGSLWQARNATAYVCKIMMPRASCNDLAKAFLCDKSNSFRSAMKIIESRIAAGDEDLTRKISAILRSLIYRPEEPNVTTPDAIHPEPEPVDREPTPRYGASVGVLV